MTIKSPSSREGQSDGSYQFRSWITQKGMDMGCPKSAIPIFFASDDNYSSLVGTCAYSILYHTDRRIDFHVLDGGISDENKKYIIDALMAFENHSIKFIDMKPFQLQRFPELRHYTVNAFARYFIPEIAPDLNKALYLDVDTIIKGDIAELYEQDLGEYPLGAVMEDFYPENYTYLQKKIYPEFSGGNKYFNSGVLLLNVGRFIAGNICQQLIDMTLKLASVLSCPDQDVLNIFFCGNFKQLDYRYNYMPDHLALLARMHPRAAYRAESNPLIIHYIGKKPWRYRTEPQSKYFWNIVDKLGWLDRFSRMEENPPFLFSSMKTKARIYPPIGKIHFLTVETTPNYTKVKLFGVTVAAVRSSNCDNASQIFYLFDFLPILKIRIFR